MQIDLITAGTVLCITTILLNTRSKATIVGNETWGQIFTSEYQFGIRIPRVYAVGPAWSAVLASPKASESENERCMSRLVEYSLSDCAS